MRRANDAARRIGRIESRLFHREAAYRSLGSSSVKVSGLSRLACPCTTDIVAFTLPRKVSMRFAACHRKMDSA